MALILDSVRLRIRLRKSIVKALRREKFFDLNGIESPQ
jgi:hypothetical protein